MITIGNRAPSNYTLLIIDNASYGSTGDQKTFTGERTSLKEVAKGSGCQNVIECSGEETSENLQKALSDKNNSYVIIFYFCGWTSFFLEFLYPGLSHIFLIQY